MAERVPSKRRLITVDERGIPVIAFTGGPPVGWTPPPLYEPLVDAIVAWKSGRLEPRYREIEARRLRVEPASAPPLPSEAWEQAEAILAAGLERRVLVMQRANRPLWVYDDTTVVTLAQKLKPNLKLECAVFRDPTR